jgi:hypothetical protein
MKREAIAVAALTMALAVPALAVPAYAAEGSPPQKESGITFEQMKANHLKKLVERIAGLQKEKNCVQAAVNQADLRACRSKHMADMKERLDDMRKGKGLGDMP